MRDLGDALFRPPIACSGRPGDDQNLFRVENADVGRSLVCEGGTETVEAGIVRLVLKRQYQHANGRRGGNRLLTARIPDAVEPIALAFDSNEVLGTLGVLAQRDADLADRRIDAI